jgi:Fuc2NAc and GlcNAc transferase
VIAIIVVLVLSLIFSGIYTHLAKRWRIVDHPNERSSHERPTPHGGGVPLLLAFLVGFLMIGDWSSPYRWLCACTFALMLLGVLDDIRSLSVRFRFGMYGLVGISTAVFLFKSSGSSSGLVALMLIITFSFAIVWALNLYNFMDGIDGMAATQCVLACSAAAYLAVDRPGGIQFSMVCTLFASSQLGFLAWNWAPARLFMGDAGSIPTGYLLAGLAGYGAIEGVLPFACWAILLAVFITDASWTLLWRIYSGQKFLQAHRLHAYQRLSRHWGSHRRVVLLLVVINLFWLFPLAWAVSHSPDDAFYLVILAYFPLLIGMAKVRKLT